MQKYSEAEKSLLIKTSDEAQAIGGAAGYYLLGTILERQARHKEAAKFYAKAVELNPTLWVAFEKLCKLEPRVKSDSIFKEDHPLMLMINQSINNKDHFSKTGQPLNTNFQERPLSSQMPTKPEGDVVGAENRAAPTNPRARVSMEQITVVDSKKTLRYSTTIPQSNVPTMTTPNINKRLTGKGLQAPQKVKTLAAASLKGMEEAKGATEPIVNPFILPTGPLMPMACSQQSVESSPPIKVTKSTVKAGIKPDFTLMSLLRQLGSAYQYLANYRCTEAVKLFKQLPKNQYNTGWTLCNVGRALFEGIRYTEAEKVYKEALNLEPYRLEGIEYYSTCLWHMKKQVDLCELSNKALATSLFAPETWCAVGNAFSLQKEHETALKFFNRALQLNPYFAYAHTLSGHEYVSNEDFEQAKKCYQRAMSCDERHYNAFWGMGNIYLKQEKYDQAIQYFKYAIGVNSKSSVLYTYLGMTYFHNRQPREALDCFEIAEKMDPNNPLNKYQKATVLVSINQLEDALKILEELSLKVPKEAPVHILIGKIYKRMGNKDKALAHFNMAMDLDPKEANMIKSLIDRLEREADLNEESDL